MTTLRKLLLVLALLVTGTMSCAGGSAGTAPDAAGLDLGTADDARDQAAEETAAAVDTQLATDAASACSTVSFASFDQAVASFLSAHGLVGASAVVVHRACGVMHMRGYGQYAADRIYLVGSSSKVVSVGVLMRLADLGLVDLDAPVGQYLSTWNSANGKPELELAQMLSNSSGLPGLLDNPFYRPYACQYRDSGTLADCARSIYIADDSSARIPPDTAFHYGGGQWQLAGGVAEVVSGKSWATLIKETYADPCGLSSLGYTNQFAKAATSGAPFGYPPFFDGVVATLPPTANPSVEGGMFIHVGDYGEILLMHLRGGLCGGTRVLSEQAVERMRSDRILAVYGGSTAGQTGRLAGGSANGGVDAGTRFAGYGLGWWIDRAAAGVIADPGLYGAFPWLDVGRGYGALVAIEADGDVGAALFATAKPVLDGVFDAEDLR
jgi:CubicO group peptidase (beta-lactamase class C family)